MIQLRDALCLHQEVWVRGWGRGWQEGTRGKLRGIIQYHNRASLRSLGFLKLKLGTLEPYSIVLRHGGFLNKFLFQGPHGHHRLNLETNFTEGDMKALLLGKAHPDQYSCESCNLLSKSHHSCSLHHCIPPGITMICIYVTRLCKALQNRNHALHFLKLTQIFTLGISQSFELSRCSIPVPINQKRQRGKRGTEKREHPSASWV